VQAIVLLTSPPPSSWRLYRRKSKTSRALVKTDLYKAWANIPFFVETTDLGFRRIAVPPRNPIAHDVAVFIECPRQRKTADAENRIKAIADKLQTHGWLVNDKLIVDIRIKWSDLPACRVTISASV
jgi:Holliday junction resolvase RusA-like endonuclease